MTSGHARPSDSVPPARPSDGLRRHFNIAPNTSRSLSRNMRPCDGRRGCSLSPNRGLLMSRCRQWESGRFKLNAWQTWITPFQRLLLSPKCSQLSRPLGELSYQTLIAAAHASVKSNAQLFRNQRGRLGVSSAPHVSRPAHDAQPAAVHQSSTFSDGPLLH